ncbi:hypothetical protein D3C71_1884550 [compost metagenome]
MFDLLKALDKRLFIALLQQFYCLTKPLIVTLDQRNVLFGRHNDIRVQLRVLSKQPPDHRQLQPIDR